MVMIEAIDVTTILLVEDQELTRLGLKMALDRMPAFRVVGEAEDGIKAVKMALELKPNVVIMDIGLPGIDGVEATNRIKKALPDTRIIMVTTADSDESIFSALNAGADGYCLKNIPLDQLALAISTVTTGAAWLDPGIAGRVLRVSNRAGKDPLPEDQLKRFAFSKNEQEILSLIEQGLSYDQIASRLMIDPDNVKGYMCQILERMVVSGRIGKEMKASDHKADQADASWTGDINLLNQSPPALTKGTILADRYVIEDGLGSGGMSRVYRARHLLMDKVVAVKMLHYHLTEDSLALKRFQQEAKTVSILNHPNIVKVFDFGLSEYRQPYLVMDYIEGKTLASVLQAEVHIDPVRAVHCFSQILDGLAAAHAKGVIHRDLKPSNIMLVDLETIKDFAMLIDFGVSRMLLGDDSLSSKLTPTGEVYGSLAYMSPEQCKNIEVDSRSDIYSLGCVMYEALTGRIMFSGSGLYEVICKHLYQTSDSFAAACPQTPIPKSLEDVVFKALAKSPEHRFQSALEMKNALMLQNYD